MPVSLRNAVLLFLTITIPLLGFACGSGDLTLDVADPEVVPQEPDFDRVFTIIQRDCVPCHGGAGGGKTAGPGRTATEPGLGDCQQVVRYREDILRTVMNDTMPN